MIRHLKPCLVYLTLILMFATLWSLGYARQCEDELVRAQHQSASPEVKQSKRFLAELDLTAEDASLDDEAAQRALTMGALGFEPRTKGL
jgi:hypothetical protein